MLQLEVNNKYDYSVKSTAGVLSVNNNTVDVDIIQVNPSRWQIIEGLRSYNVEVVSFNNDHKTATIKINKNTYSVTAKDEFDILLKNMGLSNLTTARISELKAPMPGMVLKVLVAEGDEVKKGDSLFILEAMKMENIIKAPGDVIIKSIKIKAGDKVEKGQGLLNF